MSKNHYSQAAARVKAEKKTALERVSANVSVVIISYWTGPLLDRAVMSAFNQKQVCEVIVVDNGNDALDLIRLQKALGNDNARLKIITGHGNIGFAAACNLGARAASGEMLFILNPDAILPADALRKLLATSVDKDSLWMVGGKLINPDGTEQAGSRRGPLTPWTAFVEMTQLWRLAPRHPYFQRFNRHDTPCPEKTVEMPVISGACMLMPLSTYNAIDGMDERYFLHVEDVDFCLRLRNAGGKIYFNPSAEILHYKSSSRANPIRIEFRKTVSMVKYFFTHFKSFYPRPFLWLVTIMVWLGFGFRFVKRAFSRLFGVLGFRQRRGAAALQRAKAILKRRSGR